MGRITATMDKGDLVVTIRVPVPRGWVLVTAGPLMPGDQMLQVDYGGRPYWEKWRGESLATADQLRTIRKMPKTRRTRT